MERLEKFTTIQSQFSVSRPHSDLALPFYKASLYENELLLLLLQLYNFLEFWLAQLFISIVSSLAPSVSSSSLPSFMKTNTSG
jgi:hypothetical protein